MSRNHAPSQRKAILVEEPNATEPEPPADSEELVPAEDGAAAESLVMEPGPASAPAAEPYASHAPARPALELDSAPRSASLLLPVGLVTLILGIAFGALVATGAAPAIAEVLAKSQLEPGMVFVLGGVLVGLGMLGKRSANHAEHEAQQSRRAFEHVAAAIDDALAYQRAVAERPPQNEAEALERAMLSMQRQDEKLNNLSKALKMYGKPLMEISQQSGEIAQVCGDIASTVTAFKLYTEQTGGRTDAQLKGQLEAFEQKLGPQSKALAEVAGTCKGFGESLAAMHKTLAAQSRRDDPFTKKLDELGKAIAALTQWVEQIAGSLPTRDDGAWVKNLEAKIDAARDAVLQQTRRELAGLQTQLARAPQPTPTHAAAAAPVADEARIPVAVTAPSAAPSAPPDGAPAHGPGVLAAAISGEKRTDSKNVLGAIAKLKSLRK